MICNVLFQAFLLPKTHQANNMKGWNALLRLSKKLKAQHVYKHPVL